MAKLKRDDELFNMLQDILYVYDLEPGDGSNDDLIEKMHGYDELEKKAKDAAEHFQTKFKGEKNPEKALRRYLVSLKEEAMQKDIELIYGLIDDDPTLKNRILKIVEQGIDPEIRADIDPSTLSVKDIFDESLFHERTDRWVTGKNGKEYLRATSMETRRNELIRQLSDLPYPELPDKITALREQYVQISGKKYKAPATTYKREYVTLRQRIGKLVAEKGGIVDSIERLDPAYDYRRIADKVGKLQNGNLSKEQQEFLDQQVRYLEGDAAVLRSYKELAEKFKAEVKPPSDKLSVKDQILQYRKQFGERLQEISGNADISKKSLAYLDLVESKKGDNPQLYQETVADLAKEPGIGEYRAKRWSSGEHTVPLTAWKSRASDIIKKQEERRQFLFSDSTAFEDFQEAWKDPKNRSAVVWKKAKDKNGNPVLRKDGKPVMVPEDITKFAGKYYRTGIDDKILADTKRSMTEELFSAFTSLEDFRKLWKKREYRSLIPWVQATDKNGAPVNRSDGNPLMVPKGVTRFEGHAFRTDTDSEALAAAKRERTARLKAATRAELEQDSWEDFNKKIKGKDPKYRSSWYWKEETDTDGKVTKRYLDRLVSFGGNRYRKGIDDQRLADDFARAIGEAPSIAEAAKQRILTVKQRQIDQLTEDIEKKRAAGQDVTVLEKALETKQRSYDVLKGKDYTYRTVGSYDIRKSLVIQASKLLPIKAEIAEIDPAFYIGNMLDNVPDDEKEKTLSQVKQDLIDTQKNVESYREDYKKKGFVIPDRVGRAQLTDQLDWYQTSDRLMSYMEKQSYDDFRADIEDADFQQLKKSLPVGYFRKIKGNIYRSTADADIISSYDRITQHYREREQRAMTGPAARAQPSVGQNKFGALLQQSMVTDQKIVQDAQAAFNSTSDLFSSSYGNLSAAAKQFYDRNYGVPVKEGNNYYRSIYDMPDDAWVRAEKAAGYDTPRQRSGVTSSDINTAEEEKLQQEVTADLKGRTWEPVKREDKTAAAAAQEKKLDEIVVSARAEQETKNNLRRMLQRAEKEVKRNSIGSMGLMGAFVLFNVAMTGNSREAEERRRRVEQERRIKKYGYDYQ